MVSIGVLINHTIAFLTSPLAVSMAAIVVGIIMMMRLRGRRPRLVAAGCGLALFGVAYLYLMSINLTYWYLGLGLEREFPPQRAESLPTADAIVVLGGGVGGNSNTLYYSEFYMSADRVAHAARIWKTGKAPVIITSGVNERQASLPFLKELGVPESAIIVENQSGNTEENARFVRRELEKLKGAESKLKILLVTSSWHMRRSMLMFRKYVPDIEVVPAACDYEATIGSDKFKFWESLLPNADSLLHNSYMLKEYIGYCGYKFFRR